DIVAAEGGPAPEVVFPERPADVGAVLGDPLDTVAVGQRGGRLQGARGLEIAGVRLDLVGAALGHLIDRDAGGGNRHVGARYRELHLFVGAEVEVDGRAADRVHVGDDDAVDGEGIIAAGGAVADEVGLLAALVAADVDPVLLHAGHLLQERPGVAGGGHVG